MVDSGFAGGRRESRRRRSQTGGWCIMADHCRIRPRLASLTVWLGLPSDMAGRTRPAQTDVPAHPLAASRGYPSIDSEGESYHKHASWARELFISLSH